MIEVLNRVVYTTILNMGWAAAWLLAAGFSPLPHTFS